MNALSDDGDFPDDYIYCDLVFASRTEMLDDEEPPQYLYRKRLAKAPWQGALVCDDFSGYKQSFTLGATEAGCMAHSRRKFFDLHARSKSQIAAQALQSISQLYDDEREVKNLTTDERLRIRQARSRPLADALY